MPRNQKVDIAAAARQHGTYACARCGIALFEAVTKFDVGSGFPSFWRHIGHNVVQKPLATNGRNRLQLLCQSCGLHLGHLFLDARAPTHVRYCVNAAALQFKP